MCEVASFKNFENTLTTVKVMTKTKVAPFYLGHGVFKSRVCGSVANVSRQLIPGLWRRDEQRCP